MAVLSCNSLGSKLENFQEKAVDWFVLATALQTAQIDSLREKGRIFLPWEPQNNIFLFVWVGQREGQPPRWGGNPTQKTKSKCATRLAWQKRDQFTNPFPFAFPGHYDLSLRLESSLLWFMLRKKSSALPKHFGILEVEGECQADLCSQTIRWSDRGKTHLTCDKSASAFVIALNVLARSILLRDITHKLKKNEY